MAALDTNLLVRWLTHDDDTQYRVVHRLLEVARHTEQLLWVPVTVLLELEWVLRSRYRVARAAVLDAFDALLRLPELRFDREAAVERALWRFKRGGRGTDWADCLHIGLAEADNHVPLLTFDRRAASLPGARALDS